MLRLIPASLIAVLSSWLPRFSWGLHPIPRPGLPSTPETINCCPRIGLIVSHFVDRTFTGRPRLSTTNHPSCRATFFRTS